MFLGPKMQNKPYFFFTNVSFPNRGEGGGGPPLGKNSHIFPFFFLGSFPYLSCNVFTNTKCLAMTGLEPAQIATGLEPAMFRSKL